MSVASWWRNWRSGAFADTLEDSIDRANVRFFLPQDSSLYLTRWTRRGLNEKAEWLWQNFGVIKEGVAGIARHTVGKGISLQIDSDDQEWNQLAEDDFENYALTPERCDLSGRRTFYEAQTTAIEQRIIRGEFFCAKTENPLWFDEPAFQLYDSEEIGDPASVPEGVRLLDGVEVNSATAPLRYWLTTEDGRGTPIERARMIHWFKSHAVNQVRGITDLAQAVNPMVDIHELKRLTTRSAKAHQLIALVLKGIAKKKTKGALGAIESAGKQDDGVTPDANTAQLEKLAGGAGAGIAYVGEDGDAKLISPNSPTPLVEGFITDLLMRDVCAGWGVPSEFFWNIAKLGGANTRFVLSRADLLFQILADGLITRFCTPIAFRYLSARITSGKLRACKDPNWALKFSWQTPPRVTVDNQRDGKLDIELMRNGLGNMRGYYNARGENYRRQGIRQWIREWKEFDDELDRSGLTDEQKKRIRANWRAGMPGAAPQQQEDEPQKPPSDKPGEEKDDE